MSWLAAGNPLCHSAQELLLELIDEVDTHFGQVVDLQITSYEQLQVGCS